MQEQHAQLEARSGSLYLTALHGDPEDIRSESLTWLNGASLRPGMSRMMNSWSFEAPQSAKAMLAYQLP